MIALLVGTSAAFVLCILTTPALIRVLRARGIGQQIRDDGPFAHPHEKKAGTPTMGGIAIVGGTVLGYAVAHTRPGLAFTRSGVLLVALVAVGPETGPLAEHARAAGVAVTEVPDAATALDAVTGFVHDGDAVLVKGSRAVGLELVATALRGTATGGDA